VKYFISMELKVVNRFIVFKIIVLYDIILLMASVRNSVERNYTRNLLNLIL
jgi:hypothetical protein